MNYIYIKYLEGERDIEKKAIKSQNSNLFVEVAVLLEAPASVEFPGVTWETPGTNGVVTLNVYVS